MSVLLVIVISLSGIILGKVLLKKWINHLSIYSLIWGGMILLYLWKLLPYVELVPRSWFYIFSAFMSFSLGIITIIQARKLSFNDDAFFKKRNLNIALFVDGGKTLKYALLVFSLISLFGAIQSWLVLINMYGSIPSVLINAHLIYKSNVRGEIEGIIPYISFLGYVAVFLSGIYTAYRRKFSFLTFLPFLGIVIKELATVGRAGMLLALMEFLFTFFLLRHLLNSDLSNRFKFSKKNAVIAAIILFVFFGASSSLVRISRGPTESYVGASRDLKQMKENIIITPSIYLYLSSHVAVLNQYLTSDVENTKIGENTFLQAYNLLAKVGLLSQRSKDYQRGYFIPMWSNTGTYVRELHADFGIFGVFLIPYLLGLFITWLWFRFYAGHNLIVFALLVYTYLIIGFSFLVMVTRLPAWVISLTIIILIIPVLEKIALYIHSRSKN